MWRPRHARGWCEDRRQLHVWRNREVPLQRRVFKAWKPHYKVHGRGLGRKDAAVLTWVNLQLCGCPEEASRLMPTSLPQLERPHQKWHFPSTLVKYMLGESIIHQTLQKLHFTKCKWISFQVATMDSSRNPERWRLLNCQDPDRSRDSNWRWKTMQRSANCTWNRTFWGIGLFIEKAVATRYEEGIKPSLSLNGEGSSLYFEFFFCVRLPFKKYKTRAVFT